MIEPNPAFEDLVAEALDALPDEFRHHLDNVEVVVEDWPDPAALKASGVTHRANLLGLYHGIPRTRRNRAYTLTLPDKISLYRQPILMRCRSLEDARKLVFHVLAHEIAHHFGIGDDRLREIGAY